MLSEGDGDAEAEDEDDELDADDEELEEPLAAASTGLTEATHPARAMTEPAPTTPRAARRVTS